MYGTGSMWISPRRRYFTYRPLCIVDVCGCCLPSSEQGLCGKNSLYWGQLCAQDSECSQEIDASYILFYFGILTYLTLFSLHFSLFSSLPSLFSMFSCMGYISSYRTELLGMGTHVFCGDLLHKTIWAPIFLNTFWSWCSLLGPYFINNIIYQLKSNGKVLHTPHAS